jgi:hypothetical protein
LTAREPPRKFPFTKLVYHPKTAQKGANKSKKPPIGPLETCFPIESGNEFFPGLFELMELAKGIEPPTY